MNEDILKSHWTQLKGELRKQWYRLTEDDVEDIGGDREVLLGMLQEYYGLSRSQSARDLLRWLKEQKAPAQKGRPRVAPASADRHDADPVGVAIGSAGGAAAGAVAGSFGGPVGALVGAAVGGLAGGLAGKAAGAVDPELEDAYWQRSYRTAPYVDREHDYQYYQPAYRFGWESYSRYGRRSFEEIDETLMREWDTRRGASLQTWSEARDAARDAWERVAREGGHARDSIKRSARPADAAKKRSRRRQAGEDRSRKRA
jgi:uncharacterized protein YjbJ (UPF0337 family)